MHSRDYRDIRRTLNSTPGPSPCHIPCILVRGTRESKEGGQRFWKNLALQFIECRWPRIVCRFLLSPAKRYPVENWLREIVPLCYYSLRKIKILESRGICIRIKHSRRVCLAIHCSAGKKRNRSILEVEQLGPFIWENIRRVRLTKDASSSSSITHELHSINGTFRLK